MSSVASLLFGCLVVVVIVIVIVIVIVVQLYLIDTPRVYPPTFAQVVLDITHMKTALMPLHFTKNNSGWLAQYIDQHVQPAPVCR